MWVTYMSQNDVATGGEGAIATHLNKVLVGLLNGGLGNGFTSCPVIGVKVPEHSGQVQLGGNPTDTIINITISLYCQ